MKPIRILIVDDSAVIRHLISEVLSGDPALEVVDTAPNGKIALSRIPQVKPDLVTLDIEMPEMDGIETLREIRKVYPRLPVVMFSTLTERGASATIDSLLLGANDYCTKPSGAGSREVALQTVRDQLVPKIKALCSSGAATGPVLPSMVSKPMGVSRFGKVYLPVEAVAIGISTGGPTALAELIPQIPKSCKVPIAIVQHMPPIFTKLLAERLAAISGRQVEEGVDGGVMEPGRVWIAPGGYHMIVKRDGGKVTVKMNLEPPENSCRPSVDVLFRSMAHVYGPRTLAIVMTGMGQDGLQGCEKVREASGQILAQNEETSVVWGMPGYVVRAGLADAVLSLGLIGSEIARRAKGASS